METAIVLIPEEAEHVIQMINTGNSHHQIHLITYASSVTRLMLPFSNLAFFSLPPLPPGWVAPQWLKIELGLLSGRLYFDWQEYEALCEYFNAHNELAMDDRDGGEEGPDGEDGDTLKVQTRDGNSSKHMFCARPLMFLQEWLAMRRSGQDIVHTPMGFLTQGKSLQANHPFFDAVPIPATTGDAISSMLDSGRARKSQDEADELCDVDDMGANVGYSDGESDDAENDSEMSGSL